MKKFGLIGGMSWYSTVEYYAAINKSINDIHGNNTNPRLNIASIDQKQIHDLQRARAWIKIGDILEDAALELQQTGVEGIGLCCNTAHITYQRLHQSLKIPVLHIADAIAHVLNQRGVAEAGLLGTRFTMSQAFIKDRLKNRHDIEIVAPPESVQQEIQRLIYDKLSVGIFDDKTKKYFSRIVDNLADHGAKAVILGCTELPMLFKGVDPSVPLIDSLQCHTKMIVNFIMDKQ